MKRIMVDLETLDTAHTAMIVAIGAVMFDPELDVSTDQLFYRKVDARLSVGTIGADTVMWWLRQSDEARLEIAKDGGDHISVALLALFDFCRDLNEIWAGPSHFDIPILENACRQVSLRPVWTYRQVRCWSTLRKLFPVEKPANSCAHNALADAQSQVACFRQTWPLTKLGASK